MLLVGHNPGLHELAAMLLDDAGGRLARRLQGEHADRRRSPASSSLRRWATLGRDPARLVHYVTPKEITRDGE